MKIAYRQGLISFPSDFLQIGQVNSSFVDLIISPLNPDPVVIAFASGDKNYLVSETASVSNAWGPFSGSSTQYLYWEINQVTGTLVRGATTLPLISAATAPATSSIGQMWWNTAERKMMVWNGTRWKHTLRVFAGTLSSGGILTNFGLTSQVGLNTQADAGYILTDSFGKIFRTATGEFLTDDMPVASRDTGSASSLRGPQINATANESIPAFSAVYIVGRGRIGLASGIPPLNESRSPIGVVTADVPQNDTATVATAGQLITNEQWSWDDDELGQSVYCLADGVLSTTKPPSFKNVRVGTVVSSNSILLTLDWETELVLEEAALLSQIFVDAPLTKTGAVSTPLLGITRASPTVSGYMHSSDFQRLVAVETAITLKSDIGHTHAIAEVSGLQSVLDAKANTIDVQLALDNKANLVHVHTIPDVTGLQAALDGKADTVHNHAIANVTGLQVALDGKADTVHVHTISQVTGLQIALDTKAPLVHTHLIADVSGLQVALDGKAPTVHTHTIAQVTGLQTALDGKIGFANTTPFTPLTDYNVASKKYVDDKTFVSLSDVNISAPTTGQVVTWNGTAWVAQSPSSGVTQLSLLTDVDVTGVGNGDTLIFDQTSGNWIPGAPAADVAVDHDLVNVRPFPNGMVGDERGLKAIDHIFLYLCTDDYTALPNPLDQPPVWRRIQLEAWGFAGLLEVDYGLITQPVTDYLVYDPEFELGDEMSLANYNNNAVGASAIKAFADYGVMSEPPASGEGPL